MPQDTSARKRQWLAVVLSAVVPGLGHVYLRLWRRGLLWFVVVAGSVASLVPEWLGVSSFQEMRAVAESVSLPVVLLLSAVSLLCLLDVALLASRHNRERREKHGKKAHDCPECGRKLDEEIDFCHWCTTELKK